MEKNIINHNVFSSILSIFFLLFVTFIMRRQADDTDIIRLAFILFSMGFLVFMLLWLKRIQNRGNQQFKVLSYEYDLQNKHLKEIQKSLHLYKKSEQQLLAADITDDISEPLRIRLLSDFNHQLRTPLNGILSMVTLLKDSNLNPEQLNYLEVANTSANDLLRSFNDILHINDDAYLEHADKPDKDILQYQFSTSNKILLAEDNPVNQQVATSFLKKLGLSADIVNNGLEAYESIRNNHYDLILMDCNMPIMDGYQATRKIRKFESKNKHTTIIAMTAHTLRNDRDKCFACGMDDFISKPVKIGFLGQQLDKWLNNEKESSFNQDTGLDETIVQGIKNIVGEETFQDMLQCYIEDVPGLLHNLSLPDQSSKNLISWVSELHSSSLTIGAITLASIAQEIEITIHNNRSTSELLSQANQALKQMDPKIIK